MPGEILDVTRILAPGRREPTHLPCTSGDDKGCPSIKNAFEPMVTCMKPDAIRFCTTTHRPFEFPEVAHRRYYFTPRQRISKTPVPGAWCIYARSLAESGHRRLQYQCDSGYIQCCKWVFCVTGFGLLEGAGTSLKSRIGSDRDDASSILSMIH